MAIKLEKIDLKSELQIIGQRYLIDFSQSYKLRCAYIAYLYIYYAKLISKFHIFRLFLNIDKTVN